MALQRTDVQGFSAVDFLCLVVPVFFSIYTIMGGAVTSRKNSKVTWYTKLKLAPWHFRPGIMNIGWAIVCLIEGVAAFVVMQQNGSFWHSLWVSSLAVWVSHTVLHAMWAPIFFDNRMPVPATVVRLFNLSLTIACAILFFVLKSWAGGIMMAASSFWMIFICTQDIYIVVKNDVSAKALDRKSSFNVADV